MNRCCSALLIQRGTVIVICHYITILHYYLPATPKKMISCVLNKGWVGEEWWFGGWVRSENVTQPQRFLALFFVISPRCLSVSEYESHRFV